MKIRIPDIGQKAPLFTVSTADNQDFELGFALKSRRNILLVFYRGHW